MNNTDRKQGMLENTEEPRRHRPSLSRRRFFAGAALAGLAAATPGGHGGSAMAATAMSGPPPVPPAPAPAPFMPTLLGPPGMVSPEQYLSVYNFGARGDGKTDDTAAIQKALDAAGKQRGNVVLLPRGEYLIRGSLHVPQDVTLQGIFRAPNRGAVDHNYGSLLLAVGGRGRPDGRPLISLGQNGTLYGLAILYPEQTAPERPVEYPWTVRQLSDNGSLVNVTLLNPWQVVDFGTVTGGRHYIHGLYGQPLKTGLFIDKCEDVGRVTDVHFWPFWKPRAMEFTSRHTTAFLIGRTDWQYMVNCFAIAHKIGYHFVHTPAGAPNVLLTQCGSDEGAPGTKSISVLVESGKAGGVSFLNGQFGGSPSVYVTAGNTGTVKFTNCAFGAGPMTDSVVVLEDGIASFTNCRFSGWPRKAPTIVARGGGLMVQGCAFVSTGGRHVALERGAGAAVIVGNLFHGRMRIRNQIGNRAKIGLNAAS